MVASTARRPPVFNLRKTTPVATSKTPTTKHDPVLIDFALQGGGAHGAFTWGALDRLLEEPWLQIDGISGTSAGAMNAAVLVDGHAKGRGGCSARGARGFWRRVSRAALLSPLRRGFLDVLLDRWSLGPFACLRRDGHDGASVLALRPEPGRVQPATANPRGMRRLRAARTGADQALCHRHKCPHRPRPRVPQPRDHARCAARLGLPAHHVPGRRNRRRELLGWRLFRQPHHHPLGAGMPVARYNFSADQSRSNARARQRPPARFSTGSTRSPSIRCC